MVHPHIQPLSKLGGCIVRLANITFEALERVESVDGHEQSNSPTGSQSTTPLNLFAGGVNSTLVNLNVFATYVAGLDIPHAHAHHTLQYALPNTF